MIGKGIDLGFRSALVRQSGKMSGTFMIEDWGTRWGEKKPE